MTKKAIFGVSWNLNDEQSLRFSIDFRQEITLMQLEITFFVKEYEDVKKKSLKDGQFLISDHFPILRTPKCIGRVWCLEDEVNHLQTS